MFRKAILSIVIASFAASPALAAKVDLPGQVTYRERVALPSDATLQIDLVDQSVPGAPPRLEVEAPIGPGQVPLSFKLSFEDAIIVPSHSYALIAAISAGGGLLFRNFEPYVVNPLTPEAPVLIVTNLVGQINSPNTASSEPQTAAPPAILDAIWTATELAGAPVVPRSKLTLSVGSDMRAGGSGGCNSWFAPAEIDADTIRLGSITSTRKACTEAVNQQEAAYFAALSHAATWKMFAEGLVLFGADGKPEIRYTR